MGSAYVGGLASCVWESLEKVEPLWKGDQPFLPDADTALPEKLYEDWLDAVDRSRK